MINMSATARSFIFILLCAAVSGCPQTPVLEMVLFDFETDSDLDRLQWSCKVQYETSESRTTAGGKALKLSLFPSDYPGMVSDKFQGDWRGYDELRMEFFNPASRTVQITIRIDDRRDFPGSNDRYMKTYSLHQGLNHLRIPLSMLVTRDGARSLDLSHVHRLFIYAVRPETAIVIYIDNIRLFKGSQLAVAGPKR